MTGAGERRRRMWRWAVVVWVVAVAVGGGLTLWLQDAAEPTAPYSGEREEPSPRPSLPEEWGTLCPSPTPDENGRSVVLCAISTAG